MEPSRRLRQYHVVLLGADGVGNTTMTYQFTSQHFVETYDPTLEDSYRRVLVIDGRRCLINVLDFEGGEAGAAMRSFYLRAGEGFLLVYSITSRRTFSLIRKWYDEVREGKNFSRGSTVPIMVVGNKNDLSDEHREVTFEEGEALAEELGCMFTELTAKSLPDVERAFSDVVRVSMKIVDEEERNRSRLDNPEARNPPTAPKKSRLSWKKRLSRLLRS